MFISLLITTFITAFIVSAIVASFFKSHINNIIKRIVSDEISVAWCKYMMFAIYIVGISGGVRIYSLADYINPQYKDQAPLILNMNRWVLEIYRTIIGTLQSIAWMLLVFFVIALIAYVIVKIFESRKSAITK